MSVTPQAAGSAIHDAAAIGYSKTAHTYVRGRPDYPPAVASWLQDALQLQAGKTVVDLGAGTGKFTPRLLQTGATVIAIEPVVEMRAQLSAAMPDVLALSGTAESIPLADESVDAVVCAQSFHWFATSGSLAEIHRVLKPGGRLGLIWNLRDTRVGWVARFNRIGDAFQGDTPRYTTGLWRKVFPYAGFSPLQEQHYSIGHTGSAEDVLLNRIRSTSFIAALAPEVRAQIDDQVRAFIAAEPALRDKEIVTVPYETAAFHCIKDGGS